MAQAEGRDGNAQHGCYGLSRRVGDDDAVSLRGSINPVRSSGLWRKSTGTAILQPIERPRASRAPRLAASMMLGPPPGRGRAAATVGSVK